MVANFKKTDHFLYRQWDRKIDDSLLEKILNKINENISSKTFVVVGNKLLKKFGLKVSGRTNLIIVVKKNILITLFMVEDLYSYLKSNRTCEFIIINDYNHISSQRDLKTRLPKIDKRVGVKLNFIIMSKTTGTAGWPSTTGNPSGGGRDNNPPSKQ